MLAKDMTPEASKQAYQDYLDGKRDDFPYIDEEEKEIVEAITPEFYQRIAEETEEEVQKKKDEFYKRFNLNKAIKRNIEFENEDLDKLKQDLANNGARDQEQA